MDYPKSIPGVGLVDGHFVDENPATGQVGSLIPAAWGDAITQEILNVIKAAGMVPSEANVSQLAAAVQAIAASDVKRSVLVATTGPIALSGLQSIDGVSVPAGARVLVKNQANAAQNWIYMASAGPWLRAQDADDSAKCTPGHLIGVQSGTVNAGAVWQLANTAIPVLGTTALTFVLAIGKTGVVAGEYRRVIVDALGRVTAGSNPDTLAGYGITDGVTKTELESGLASKASQATTLGGYGITDGVTKTELNGYIKKGQLLNPGESPKCMSAVTGAIGGIGDDSGALEVRGKDSGAAVLSLHRPGACVVHLGLDTDNQLKIGGGSMGNAAHAIWHSGNFDLTGVFMYFPFSNAPAGFLKANGAAVSRSAYPGLFAKIGTAYGAGDGSTTFNLPDLRGEFLRGWDDGRGVDPGRALGSWQADELKSHTHAIKTRSYLMPQSGSANNCWAYEVDAQTGATGGSETRPRSLAFLACIKY